MSSEIKNFPEWPRIKKSDWEYFKHRAQFFFKRRSRYTADEARQRIYIDFPVWKSVLIMSWPAILQAVLFTSFTFVDVILSVTFAADSYSNLNSVALITANNQSSNTILSASAQVRIYLNAVTPITTLLLAVSTLFSAGVATRVSINIGMGNFSRAREILRHGNTYNIVVALLLIPLFAFTSTYWIETQFAHFDRTNSQYINRVSYNAYNYVVIIVGAFPLQTFWQLNSAMFRVDGRNKVALFIAIFPILINLLFDYIFMGVLNLAIEGGAWASFIAQATGVALTLGAVSIFKSDLISIRNLFSFKLRWIILLGIVLAGVTPFIRTVTSSVTIVLELDTSQTTSEVIEGGPTVLSRSIATGVGLYGLFFPVVFNLANSVRPIMSYSQAAKLHDRVRQAYYYTAFYSVIIGLVIYLICVFGLARPYMELWNFAPETRDRQDFMNKIYLISIPVMGVGLTGITLFGSVERIGLATIAAAMRGIILTIPLIFIFQTLTIKLDDSYLYYYAYPVATIASSTIIHLIARRVLNTLAVPYPTLNERVDAMTSWFEERAHRNPFTSTFWNQEKRKAHQTYLENLHKAQANTTVIEKAKKIVHNIAAASLGETAAVAAAEQVVIPDAFWPALKKLTINAYLDWKKRFKNVHANFKDQVLVRKHKKHLKKTAPKPESSETKPGDLV